MLDDFYTWIVVSIYGEKTRKDVFMASDE